MYFCVYGEMPIKKKYRHLSFHFILVSGEMETIDDDDEEEDQQPTEIVESPDVQSRAGSIDEAAKIEPIPPTSLLESLLLDRIEEIDGKKTKKKKKVKTGRQKELVNIFAVKKIYYSIFCIIQERLTKATKSIFTSPEQLNIVCERINALLSDRKTMLLAICRSFDKLKSGRLPYEQFRLGNNKFFLLDEISFAFLVIRDRLPSMSAEDTFVLTKLFEIDDLIDYRSILDEKFGNGILQHIKLLPVPKSKEIVLPKELFNQSLNLNRYVTVHLRCITFDSYSAYHGHIHLTVPDYISIYGLSKMIIEERNFATRSISIFREKIPSHTTVLDPMHSLEYYQYVGAYIDSTHNQSFPTYTLYYDYSSMDVDDDCPILKCDYYMK